MGVRLSLALRGELTGFAAKYQAAVGVAVASVIRGRTTRLKTALRKQVEGAGLGRLANTIRSEILPARGPSLTPIGRVFSKALVKGRPGGLVDLISVFDEGAVIRAQGTGYLALAEPIAGRRGKRRAQPKDFPAGFLVFIPPTAGRHARLVHRVPGQPDVTYFLLVRQVTLKKRLDVASAYARAIAGLDVTLAGAIDRELAKRLGREGLAA